MKPTFSKAGASTVTFSRDATDPVQFAGRFIILNFSGLIKSDITNLETFINDSNVDGAKNTFTYTDSDGNTYTVRFWNDLPNQTKDIAYDGTVKVNKHYTETKPLAYTVKSGTYEINITLRQE